MTNILQAKILQQAFLPRCLAQAWYADDATGASSCKKLRSWWDELSEQGPLFCYYPNASKIYLVVKEEYETSAIQAFADTGIHVTSQGKRHLGAAVGSKTFTEEYVNGKVQAWTKEIKRLAEVAISQPHAAYAAFTHGPSNRWSYVLRTIPDIEDLLLPLEDAISQHLIPALTGRPPCSSIERDMLALPIRHGGLGLSNPGTSSSAAFQASVHLTGPLVALIMSQETNLTVDHESTSTIKKDIRKNNHLRQIQQTNNVYDQLSPELKRCIDLSREKGSSSWLSVLPLKEHGFYLHKGEFRDALCLRYGWKPSNIPQTCNCGSCFTVDHAIICHMGGFPTIHHNEIRDITSSLLTEVCHNVTTEPPLTGETFDARSANTQDNTRLDIRARGFWNTSQDAFFDVRVFYPNASSNRSTVVSSAYRRHEQAKKREYGQRVRDVENGVFTPLVLSIYYWRHGERGNHLLQATCRYDCPEKTTPILNGYGMAEVSVVLRLTQVIYYVHPWQIIPLPPNIFLRHFPHIFRGSCPPSLNLLPYTSVWY